MPRRPSAFLRFALALAFTTAIGCGSKKGLVSATGRVELNGQPLTSGFVSLSPKGNGPRATGTIKSDGTFVLMTGDEAGAAPGEYLASVIAYGDAPASTDPRVPAPYPKTITPEKYGDPSTSGLKVTVSSSGLEPATLSLTGSAAK